MSMQKTTCVGGLALALAASSVLAEPVNQWSGGQPVPAMASMTDAHLQHLEPMDDREMAETRGELWPLVGAISAIVAVDLALQSYFWGTYVPSVAGGSCATCNLPRSQHR